MLTPRLRQYGVMMIGAAMALGLTASPLRADGGGRWRSMSDAVFYPVARDIDMPNALIPEVIAQDGQGFLWIGEETGLLRWDGYRLRAYAHGSAAADGLHDDFIQALHSDASGRLWIGTVSGGLARFDAASGRAVSVPLRTQAGPVQHVWAIDDDGAGGVWAATSSGLFHLDGEGRVIGELHHRAGDAASLPDDTVSAMLRDHTGTLWVGTGAGLARAVNNTKAFVSVTLPARRGAVPKVLHLFEDSEGRIWAGTRQNGAYVIQPGQDQGQRIAATAPDEPGADAAEITSAAEVMPGTVWLGTFGRGIVEVDAASLRARWIRHDPLVSASLDSDIVRTVFRDRSGLIWVGTNKGLSQHTPGNGALMTMFGAPGRGKGLTDGDVGAILVRRDGTSWIGTEGGGLNIIDAAGARVRVLPVGRVFCLAEAAGGGVLVGTNDGLFLADGAGRGITKLTVPGRANSAGVFALHPEGDAVWLGGLDDGLWQLRIDPAGAVTVLRHRTEAELGSPNVRSIDSLPDGRLAVGTDDGFAILDRGSGAVQRIRPDPADPNALSGQHVMSLLTDRRGRLWVGTDSGGINILDAPDAPGPPRFRHLTSADGLPNDDIDKMLLDRQGRVWASTDSGLAMIDPDSLAAHALRRADGVAVSAYWSGAGTVTPDGDLLFGGLGGMTFVRPDRIVAWTYQPPVAVTSISVGGKPVPMPAASASGPGWVQIPPEANSLSVEFSALDFSAPALNRYAYRLAGFDRDWTLTDAAHRTASYTNLPPGDYTLWLRGSNRRGAWTQARPQLRIRVLPAWFQTISFRMCAAFAAALAILSLVQGRTLLLRQRQRELERQVADRTAELIASQHQLRHFAYVDALTGLPNRRAFNERLRTMIADAAAGARQFALLLIDLDGFKQVNDSLGHDAGDELLVLAAGRMRGCLADGDFAARLGGDEFAILIDDVTDLQLLEHVCDRVAAALAEPATVGGSAVKAGASLGVALYPAHGAHAGELLRHVDMALYDAKRGGRGVWRWYRERKNVLF